MRKSGLIAFLMIVLVPPVLYAQQQQTPSQRPNILFIFGDDWGFGDLGSYGNKKIQTPYLDAFAATARRFTRFHVTSGVCSPSRVSILTGQYPARYRVHGHFAANELNEKRKMPNWLPDTISTLLPALLRDAGYATAHFGKWHLGGGGLPHGDPAAPLPATYGYDEARVWNGNGPTWKGTERIPSVQYLDDDTLFIQQAPRLAVDATLAFIDRSVESGKPFYINLWLKEPHAPLWPSEEQRKLFLQVQEPEQTYYSLIYEADRQIGRLLQQLERKGLLENTLIVFSSDNGPEAGAVAKGAAGTAGNYKGGKRSLYEGGICVPLMAAWKGKIKTGSVDSTSILSSADLFPGFCRLAGVQLPAWYQADGEDITGVLLGHVSARSKPLFWEWRFANPAHATYWMDGAVIDGDFKLVQNTQTGRAELYNIKSDPFEKNNIAAADPGRVRSLQQSWAAWKRTLPE